MRGEGVAVLVVLSVFAVRADNAETTAPPTTPDVNATWLESFRRSLLREGNDFGPAPSRALPGLGPDSRRGGALVYEEHSARSQENGSRSSPEDEAASREHGISRRDLQRPAPAQPASLTGGELDLSRKAFLDNLYELEDQLKPVYLSSNKGTDAGKVRSRKKNEENVQETPPYIEQNGVRRYKVNMDAKQMLRNQFDDGLSWLQDVITQELSDSDDGQYENEDSEDRRDQDDNERPQYNQGRPQDNQGRPPYERDERLPEEQRYQDSSSSEESRESSEETRDLDVSEYKQETLRSRYVEGRGHRARSASEEER